MILFSTNKATNCRHRHARADIEACGPGAPRPTVHRGRVQFGQGPAGTDRDILDIARIESGRLNLTPERVNLVDSANSVIRVFDGLARQKCLNLSLIFKPEGRGPAVLIDPLRFKQVLTNLISNAIKFTEHGEVTLELNLLPTDTADQIELQLSVKDTGIGISQRDQERLFEPFTQVENTGQLALNGACLGLVICRNDGGLSQADQRAERGYPYTDRVQNDGYGTPV